MRKGFETFGCRFEQITDCGLCRSKTENLYFVLCRFVVKFVSWSRNERENRHIKYIEKKSRISSITQRGRSLWTSKELTLELFPYEIF